MRPADLLGRTSVRLALAFALLLIAAFALAGGVAWGMIRGQLMAQEDRRLLQAWEAIATGAADGEAELTAAVEEQLATVPDLSSVILLTEASGGRMAGNVVPFDAPDGWSDLPAARLGAASDHAYRVLARNVGDRRLVVGSDAAALHEVGEIVAGALGWASVAALALALGAGAAIAAGVQARMEAMEAALSRVAEGDLGARLPATGRGDLARLARRINAALARLEGVVEGMRQVSTDIAHDLRTPLGRLRLRVEEAAGQAPEGSLLARDLLAALEESDHVDAIFAGLLRIAQIEAGARRDHFAPLNLADVLDRIHEAYADVAEDAGQTLTLAAPGLAPMTGDRDLLVQLFANLVENAIRHGRPGTAIALAVRHEDNAIVAIVRDTGPGIPAPERTRVLRRLYRMEASRTSPGTGLGLALVKAVADLHGAELTLEDAGPGLLVTLRFPPPGARS